MAAVYFLAFREHWLELAVKLHYSLAQLDSKLQPGRTSSAEYRDDLKMKIDTVLRRAGETQAVLVENPRDDEPIRNYIQTRMQQTGSVAVSHAIIGGTPNHSLWPGTGDCKSSEFADTGPFLSGLATSKTAAGDRVTDPVCWMTIRSADDDKFAQPDAGWPGIDGKPTGVIYAGQELKAPALS